MPTESSLQMVQTLYITYYGRAADPDGLQFWAERLDEADGDVSAILDDFGSSQEYTENFAGLDNETLVNNLYLQLFGRDAEAEGLDGYVASLESGDLTLAEIAAEIAGGAQEEDAQVLEAKLEAADDFTAALAERPGGQLAYQDDAIQAAKDYLAQVTVSEQPDPTPVVDSLVSTASQAYVDDIQTLYVAYYGRPANTEGLAFWTEQALANDGDLTSLIQAFGNSDEYAQGLSQLEPEGQVTALYQQLFGRDPEPEGLTFYSEALESGALSLADIALAIAKGAGANDEAVLNARVEAAKAITEALNTQEEQDQFATPEGQQAIKELLAGVNSGDQAQDLVENVDEVVSESLGTAPPVVTVTLAEALDQPPESAYRLDASATHQAGSISVSQAQGVYAEAQALISDAQNADEIDIAGMLEWSIEDEVAPLLDNSDDPVVAGAQSVSVTGDQVTLAQAQALQALENFDGNLPTVLYTLEEAQAAEQLPSDYAIDAGAVLQAGTLSVADAQTAYSDVAGLIGGASNSDELDIADVLEWSIEDEVAPLLDNSDDPVVAGAQSVSVTSDQVTLAQAQALQALENFDGNLPTVLYTLEQALGADDSLHDSLHADYAIGDLPFQAEELTVDAVGTLRDDAEQILDGAANSDALDIEALLSWTLLDSGEALLGATDSETFQQAEGFAFDSGFRVHVDAPVSGHDTLQGAIDGADTGATLLLSPGDYQAPSEGSISTEDLTLLGANLGRDGAGERNTESIIEGKLDVAADDLTIDGFSIDNDAGFALSMSAGTNLVFQNNIVTGENGTQLNYYGGPNDTLTFRDNLFDGTGIGQTEGIDGLNIVGNTVRGENIAVGSGADSVVIEGNTVTDNYSGFNIYSGAETVELTDNSFDNLGSAVLFRNGGGDWSDGDFTLGLDQFRDEVDELLEGLINAGKHSGTDTFDLSSDFNVTGFDVDAQGVVESIDSNSDDEISWDANAGSYEGLAITLTGVQLGDDIAGLFSGTNSDIA